MNTKLLALAALTALALVAFAPSAAAHASANTADGKYRVTWGFLDEPAFAGQKNKLDLVIREIVDPATNSTGAGVGGISADNLTVELHIGEEHYDLGAVSAYRGAKGANAGPGNYTSANPVYITRPGIYTLHIEGEIHGTPVDMEIPAAHEYEPMSEIAFPDELDDASTLAARIAALEAEVAALKAQQQTQATQPATVTSQPTAGTIPVPAAGAVLVALFVASVALALRRE